MSLVLHCLWLMEHQKPISAQCDTFLRTWVYQGHINIINEQEADWRETEWQKEGEEANRKVIFIFVSNTMYIYLWFWWWLPPRSHFLSDGDTIYTQDLMRLPTISLVHAGTNGWQHLFFSKNPFGKSHLPLLFHAQWQRTRKCTKETYPLMWRQLYLSGYVTLCWA